jgi:hypothetical protein
VRWTEESQVGRKFSPKVEFLAHRPEEAMERSSSLWSRAATFGVPEIAPKSKVERNCSVHFAGSTRKSGCRAGLSCCGLVDWGF